MIRKIGQIIRRGPSTWLVRIYVGRDPEMLRRKYIGSAFTVVCALLRPTSTACSLSGILDATSVLDGKPSASTSIKLQKRQNGKPSGWPLPPFSSLSACALA